jgi:hypothetical protein
VYFPGLGWVEFEPTVSQLALPRPRESQRAQARLENDETQPSAPPPLSESDLGFERAEDTFLGAGPAPLSFLSSPLGQAVIAGATLVFAALLLFFNARYRYLDRVPVYLSRAYGRGDRGAPPWLRRWTEWSTLPPIQRSFHAINLGLRWLDQPAPIHATPKQRAESLSRSLPSAGQEIQQLLQEHHRALFTIEPADAGRARKASLRIIWKAITQRVREVSAQWANRYNGPRFP